MNTIVTLSQADINARVQSTNSFSKGEMLAHRGAITDARRAKRETLSKLTGSNVGSVIDKLREDNGAKVIEMKTSTSATQQKWTIVLSAKRTTTEAERLKEKAIRLQKALNKVEEELETATATTAETTVAKA